MPRANTVAQYAWQKAVVERLQTRLRFELLVLRRIEARARPATPVALAEVLRRAQERCAADG